MVVGVVGIADFGDGNKKLVQAGLLLFPSDKINGEGGGETVVVGDAGQEKLIQVGGGDAGVFFEISNDGGFGIAGVYSQADDKGLFDRQTF